jgi:hypothetical protein
VTPEFHPAAQEELAAAVKIGDMRAVGLGLELLRDTQRSARVGTPLARTASGSGRIRSASGAPTARRR